MKKKMHRAHPLIALIALSALAVPLALAADAPKVVGTWDAVASTPDGDIPGVMTVTETEGALDVEMELAGLKRRVTDEKVEGQALTMTVYYDGAPYDVELTVDGDTMEGTYTGAAASGPLTATRQK